jgi:hypothetical protein
MIYYLKPLAEKHNMYLDFKHPRKARLGNREVIWIDINGNKHKLDIVFEEGGTEDSFGKPRAFIEMAWRRYTKHSKNKAQEIAGAIVPLISQYRKYSPFYGVIIAGEFTGSSITQMTSQGFQVVYFSYDTIVQAFATVGINARWEENTPESELQRRIGIFEDLSDDQRMLIVQKLIVLNSEQLQIFCHRLEQSLLRKIERVRIFSLHGISTELKSIEAAYDYIASYDETTCNAPLVKFEIIITYNNGDRIEAQYADKQSALSFLTEYL